jgi:cyanophycinase
MDFNKGILIPIGGNEDKGIDENERHTLDFISEGILQRVVKEAGGTEVKIVVIPAASSIPEEVGKNYLSAFGTLGCKNVSVLDIRTKEDAETDLAIALISTANCIMFSGGDQSKITRKIANTKIHKILKERYQNDEKFVIAGTSAGAMAMATEMISGGNAKESFFKGAVKMRKGLALIDELTIDTHFIQRGRFGRLAEAVARFPRTIGIGLAEDTGLVIKNNTAEVIGSGMVIIFDGRKLKHNNEKILKPGTPMSLTHLKTHILAIGDRFNFKKNKVKVHPLEEPFNGK